MKMYKCIALPLIFLFRFALGHNILGVFPHPGQSHFFAFDPLMTELSRRGHNVTIISYFKLKSTSNYRHVSLGKVEEVFDMSLLENWCNLKNVDPDSKLRQMVNIFMLSSIGEITCDKGLSSKELQQFLKERNSFDMMIVEQFNTDCFFGLVRKFKCPVIGIESATIMSYSGARYGNPFHPAYMPNNCVGVGDRMTFLERLENTLVTIINEFYHNFVMVPNDKKIVQKYLGRKAAELETYIYNTSLMLTNSHFSLNHPRPYVPAVIEVGGLHIGKPKQLPQNLKKFIEDSEHGVIYFSFGSIVKTHTMSPEKLQAFFKAFSRLPQRVLWRWENETMEGKPDNVMFQKWLPQFDILSHPNVKAFISHGGLLGAMEAVHCGVPMVVMPQLGDQHTNAKAIEASGGGVILRFSQVTEETLYKALKKILSSSFQTQAMELSERFRDRPLPPLETAIYWVEYVARHRGAPHLRSAAAGMPWYQYYLVDVISFLILTLGLFIYMCYVVVRFAINRLSRRPPSEKIKAT